ncbi:MAG TPA: type II secretion system F family protein, partial [Acidimicrobiales bacterium]|nr:type II secretion system F family protein [Acidimicrobiales bacterium]
REMGYTPISIEPRTGKALQKEISIPLLSNRVRLKDLAVACRQFATMINSGLTLVRSLGILAEQCENSELARILEAVRLDVERGSSLSDALSKHPKAFDRLFVSMVRAGEAGGTLDLTLLRLASTIEKQVELRRRIKSAMTYPVVVMVVVLLILTIMLVFIVPTFKKMYASLGGILPLPTRILLTVSNTVVHWSYIVLAVIAALAFAGYRYVHTEKGRARYDELLLRIPVFGALVRKTALARFSRTLASLVQTGVPILESLDIVAATCGNTVVANAARGAKSGVQVGEAISKPLLEHPIMPPMVVQMIAVGEQTGALDAMLEKIADFYEAEVAATVEALTSLIEPILIVIMGVAVGAMVISLYLPMFDIIKLIK